MENYIVSHYSLHKHIGLYQIVSTLKLHDVYIDSNILIQDITASLIYMEIF